MLQDKMIASLTAILSRMDVAEEAKETLLNVAVNHAGELYWQGHDAGRAKGVEAGFTEGWSQGYDDALSGPK